ncbi:terpene synthase family protein [Paraburkholderia elongata]|uniref:Terpene synthase n=1 Tax=Paraburkholderia elongata TaxID=2675747 RepID=A0A972NP25_9BURK|nr:terpene synthase [Paraburkholderia elongata]NPT57146.1 terpene synthase [Paraburkholderia elongata]
MSVVNVIDPEDLVFPAVWCPISPAIHPAWRELDARALAWADRFGLCSDPVQRERLVRALAGDLAGRIMPRSNSRSALQVATDYLMWLFVFDDTYCDEGVHSDKPGAMMELALQLARVVETPRPNPAEGGYLPVVAALADIRRRLEDVASPVQIARWGAAVRAYLMCQAWEALNRANRVIPTLDQYAASRIDSGSLRATIFLQDVGNGFEVPHDQTSHPHVQALIEMTCTIVGWDNDIFSYAKETRRGGDWHNLVAVLAHEHGYSLGQALTEAVALRDRVLNAYLALRDQILGGASPHLARFIADLDAWNRGNIDWSANCGRYINATDGSRSRITLTSQARETTLEPIPVPSVRWWWQCLTDLDATTTS